VRVLDLGHSLVLSVQLIAGLDPELFGIIALSLRVSLLATSIAFMLGIPIGAFLAIARFPGRSALVVIANALLGLPPVVVGLVVYLLLSRSGPLGSLGCCSRPPPW
jgi:tungstate transport system permease protein